MEKFSKHPLAGKIFIIFFAFVIVMCVAMFSLTIADKYYRLGIFYEIHNTTDRE